MLFVLVSGLSACTEPAVVESGTVPPTDVAIPSITDTESSPTPGTTASTSTSPSSVSTPDTGSPPSEEGPDWPIEDTELYLNIGDSVAAGYDAAGQYGYAWLLHQNDDVLAPAFVGVDLWTLAGAELRSITESGATSGDVLANVLGASLPDASGPVVATISVGGNDFNDDITVMLSEALTRVVAAEVRANIAGIVAELSDRYDDLHVYVLNIQDPTDGTGSVPPQYDSDMCGVIQSTPAFLANVAVTNLGILNDEIAAEAAAQGAELIDYHGHFSGHGLNSADGWMSDDCAHPTTLGHHEIRRVTWSAWTGDLL